MSKHFENKDPLAHVREKRIEGTTSVSEVHGTEMPGHVAAGADACRDTALVMLLLWLFLELIGTPFHTTLAALAAFGLAWVAWKGGRSGWLGWSRLERLHRLIEQEKYEIEHHRPQEREELLALYREKGVEGKLLDDLVDVLMADQDRLLKVMLEEEMGLTLQAYEHPMQQVIGAILGGFVAYAATLLFYWQLPSYGPLISAFLLFILSSIISARYEKNRQTPAVIWNLSLGLLTLGLAFFLFNIWR